MSKLMGTAARSDATTGTDADMVREGGGEAGSRPQAGLSDVELQTCVGPRELAALEALRLGTAMPAGVGIRRDVDLAAIEPKGAA